MKNLLLIILTSFCTVTYGYSIVDENTTISEILSNGHKAILRDEGDRIYLYPSRIIPTDKGVFLKLDQNQLLPLHSLYSDQSGCFVECKLSTKITKRCPNCGKERTR